MESDVRVEQSLDELIQAELDALTIEYNADLALDEVQYIQQQTQLSQDGDSQWHSDEEDDDDSVFQIYLSQVQQRVEERATLTFSDEDEADFMPKPKLAFQIVSTDEGNEPVIVRDGLTEEVPRFEVDSHHTSPSDPKDISDNVDAHANFDQVQQAWCRPLKARLDSLRTMQQEHEHKTQTSAASTLQAHVRGWLYRKHHKQQLEAVHSRALVVIQQRHKAATIIQCSWRGQRVRQQYRQPLQLACLRANTKTRFLQRLRTEGSNGFMARCRGFAVRCKYRNELATARKQAEATRIKVEEALQTKLKAEELATAQRLAQEAKERALDKQIQEQKEEDARQFAAQYAAEAAAELVRKRIEQEEEQKAKIKRREATLIKAQDDEKQGLEAALDASQKIAAHLDQWQEWIQAELARVPGFWKVYAGDTVKQNSTQFCQCTDGFVMADAVLRVLHVQAKHDIGTSNLDHLLSLRVFKFDLMTFQGSPQPLLSVVMQGGAGLEGTLTAPFLRYLDLSTTPCPNFQLRHTSLLSVLNLSGCELLAFPDLTAAPALTSLDVSSNQLDRFSTAILQRCPRLQRCDMTNNPVTTLQLETLLPVMARVVLSTLPPGTQVPSTLLSTKSSKGVILSRKQVLLSTHPLWRKVQSSCQPKVAALMQLTAVASHNTHGEAATAINNALLECYASSPTTDNFVVASPPLQVPYTAARIIQAAWRGYHLRSRLTEILARAMLSEEGEGNEDGGLTQDAFVVDEDDFVAAPPKLPSPTSWSKPAEPQAYPLPPLSRPASSCHPSRLATANRRNTSDSRSGSATIPHEGAQLHPPRVVKSADAAVPLQPEGSADTSGWGSKTTQALFKARQRTMVKTKRMRRR